MRDSSASTWFLPRHVYACTLGDVAVLLDLRADRYHGLTRSQNAALSLVVRGWPHVSAPCAPESAEEARKLACDLTAQGLLTQDDSRGKSASAVALPRVVEQLHVWDGPDWSAIGAKDWCTCAIAWARAAVELRLSSLARIVSRVERRKAARVPRSSFDPARTRELVHTFRALRPLFYTTVDRCLLDSLVLIEFLALHDQFPTWVIAVRTDPFGAHSWVQHDQYVLNGAPTFVRAFTPILAI